MKIFVNICRFFHLRKPALAGTEGGAPKDGGRLLAYAGQWRSLKARAGKGGLLTTMLTVGSVTLLVKIAAAGKETFVARQLGVGDALDAFLIAYSLPAIAMNIISGSFNSALIPTYIHVQEHGGKSAAQHLFSSVMLWSIGLLLLVSVMLALSFPLILPFLASSFRPEKLAFTRLLFWAILPIILVTGLATTWAAVLNAEGEFALPASIPLVTSLIVAGFLFLHIPSRGVWGLTAGTLVGACLEASLLGSFLSRRGISLRPRWQGIDADLRQVMSQYAPMAAAALVFSGTSIADQAIAAHLGAGNVAALNYGNKIISLCVGASAMAVSTSVLPHFSRLAALQDWHRLRRDLRLYTVLLLTILIPLALLLILFSVPLVRLVFERGAFTAQDTLLVGHVQACFALQIPFFTIGMMYLRVLSALKISSRNFFISSISVVLNFVLDLVFAKYLGIVGIALSTTVVAMISAGIYYWVVLHAIPGSAAPSSHLGKEKK